MTVFRWLNNNIGCIEIKQVEKIKSGGDQLNNNIGCIEIRYALQRKLFY